MKSLRAILGAARTVAVVGLSPDPSRASHRVALYLQSAGYRILPVNPNHAVLLGEPSYPSLTAAARTSRIDIVDVFRRSEFVGAIVDESVALHPQLIWLQVGVRDSAACARAEAAGIPCVMDRCLMVEHRALLP